MFLVFCCGGAGIVMVLAAGGRVRLERRRHLFIRFIDYLRAHSASLP